MLRRLIEARWLQDLAGRLGFKGWERFLTFRHDLSTNDKMRRVFRRREDPYDYRSSPYELERLSAMREILGSRSFGKALEIGCAEGEFTRRLVEIAERVVTVDLSKPALERARARVASPKVEWVRANMRHWDTEERFDLVVMAEVIFYLGDPTKGPAFEAAFDRFVEKSASWLAPGGLLLLAHGFGNDFEKAAREDYVRRYERAGLRTVRQSLTGERPHDKGTLRCFVHLMEKERR